MNRLVVIDTNVLVSSLLSSSEDAATVQVVTKAILGEITPVVNRAILEEYQDVLSRQKFGFSQDNINYLLSAIEKYGITHEPKPSGTIIKDIDDIPFFDTAFDLQDYGAYLITGNMKHFPKVPFIISPREYINTLSVFKELYSAENRANREG